MKKILAYALLTIIVASCTTVMFTGRKQVKLIPGGEMKAMAVQNYSQFLNENKLSTNKQYQAMLKSVGRKMQLAVEEYMRQTGNEKEIANYEWEFNVVASDQINAWAMPGGKIVFYEGIMPVCENESGIAVVMGHEIAHVLAKHGNERMSQQMVSQLGGAALNVAIANEPAKTKAIYNSAFALGAQYGALLPFSRLHEREADKIGQIVMALAGYDPAYAIPFWEKMNQMGGGQAPPEFMSTHPSYNTRIQVLTDNIPEARKYMKK